MKILYLLFTTLIIINNISAHDNNKKKHEVKETSEVISSGVKSDRIIDVSTIGMVCDFCAQSIEKVFMKRDEVQGIKIDLNNQKIIIFLKQELTLEENVILKLFEDAGYGVENITKNI